MTWAAHFCQSGCSSSTPFEVADEVRCALLHSGQVRVELVPAGVVVAHQVAVPALEDAEVGDGWLGTGGHPGVVDQPRIGRTHGDRVWCTRYLLTVLVEVVFQHVDRAFVCAEHVLWRAARPASPHRTRPWPACPPAVRRRGRRTPPRPGLRAVCGSASRSAPPVRCRRCLAQIAAALRFGP